VTRNPYLKRLLGEAGTPAEFPPPENIPPPAQDDPQDQAQEQEQIDPGADPQSAPQAAPQVQELVRQWQSGEHMGVAARLMFSEASYVTFVDLCFIIGQAAGRELGELLDELADTQGIEPPETPPEYRSVLQRVAGADEEEGVL